MALEDIANQAQMEIEESHNALFKSIDVFSTLSGSKADTIVCVIGEKEDHFKKEINSLNNLINSSQNQLSALTTKYMIQQKDCTNTESKINTINDKIYELNNTKSVLLPKQLNEMNHHSALKIQELHQKKLKLKDLILKNEKRIKYLAAQCESIETYFGIDCYVIPNTHNVRISFNEINRYNPQKQYCITLAVIADEYRIIECDGAEQHTVKYLENRLNSPQMGLSQFIKLVRKYFVLSVEKEYTERQFMV